MCHAKPEPTAELYTSIALQKFALGYCLHAILRQSGVLDIIT